MKIKKLLIIPDKTNIDKSIELAQKYDCGFEYNDFFIPSVLDDEGKVEEIIKFYKSQHRLPEHCTCHGAFFDVTIFSDDPLIRQVSDKRIEQSLKIASRLGAKGIVFHTNFMPNFNLGLYEENWVKRNTAYWKEKLEKYIDLEIYIENMFDMEPKLLARLGEAMREETRFGVCLDYAHAHVFGNEDKIDEWIDLLAPYVKHIHINDNDFMYDSHMAVGAGAIDWIKFKKFYEKYFKEASVLLEVKGFDNIEKSLEYICKL